MLMGGLTLLPSSVRMNVMQCIRQKAQLCPESTTVLRELGLDMQSMQQGVEILCGYPKSEYS